MPNDPSAIFLLVCVALFVPAIGLPLLLHPVGWARMLRWSIPDDRKLVLYLGRCLGALVIAIAGLVLRAAFVPEMRAPMLETLIAAFLLQAIVHTWGAIRREQPMLETAEIPVYLALAGVAAWLRFAH